MRQSISIDISATDRQHLLAIVTDRDSPQKAFWRAQIVLLTVDGSGTMKLSRRTGTSKQLAYGSNQAACAAKDRKPGMIKAVLGRLRPERQPLKSGVLPNPY